MTPDRKAAETMLADMDEDDLTIEIKAKCIRCGEIKTVCCASSLTVDPTCDDCCMHPHEVLQ